MNNIIGILIIISFVAGFAIGLGAEKHANKIGYRVGYGGLERIDDSQDPVYINCSKDEKETTLKDRVSKLENDLEARDKLEMLEKKGVKEGAVVIQCHPRYFGAPSEECYLAFVVKKCTRETLCDNMIEVEDVTHNYTTIDLKYPVHVANEEERKEFIQEYNDYADKLKIEIPSEDD